MNMKIGIIYNLQTCKLGNPMLLTRLIGGSLSCGIRCNEEEARKVISMNSMKPVIPLHFIS